MWNTQILSESLAISLGFAALAAWWRFAASPTRARARWGFAFLIAWLVVRDAHVLPATVVIVPVMALVVAGSDASLGPGVRRTLVIGARRRASSPPAYSYFAQSASHRATLSFHNAVGVRILPDPQLPELVRRPRDAARRRAAHPHRQERARRRLLQVDRPGVRDVPALGARRGPARARAVARRAGAALLRPACTTTCRRCSPATCSTTTRRASTTGCRARCRSNSAGRRPGAGSRRGSRSRGAALAAALVLALPPQARARARGVRRDRARADARRAVHDVGRRPARDAAPPDRHAQPAVGHPRDRRRVGGRHRDRRVALPAAARRGAARAALPWETAFDAEYASKATPDA